MMKRVLEVLKKIWKAVRANLGLKLLSLFFALILWNYVIAEANPVSQRVYHGIPLDIRGENALKLNNLTLKGNKNDYLKPISLTVNVARSDIPILKEVDITAYIDVSNITRDGPQKVKIIPYSPKGTVLYVTPDTITVTVEKQSTKMVPVECDLTGTLPEGFWSSSPEVTPKTLEITGPLTDVQNVDRAKVQVSLDNLTSSLSTPRDYILLDKLGQPLSGAGLEFNSPNCIVNLQVLPKKSIKVVADNSLSGNLASGYEITDIKIYPATVEVAGPADVLNTMDTINVPRIDIEDMLSNFNIYKALELPKGVRAIAESGVTVSVKIGMKMTTVTLGNLPVSVTGLGQGLKVSDKITSSALLTCPELYSKNVIASKVHLYVDASDLTAGKHTLSIRAEADPSIGSTGIVLMPAEVTINIVSQAAALPTTPSTQILGPGGAN
jgi:YbbR domain-containing protein